jgi:hypothetical protein
VRCCTTQHQTVVRHDASIALSHELSDLIADAAHPRDLSLDVQQFLRRTLTHDLSDLRASLTERQQLANFVERIAARLQPLDELHELDGVRRVVSIAGR